MTPLILRDLKLAIRSGGAWLLGIFFFALFLTFCVIAVGADKTRLGTLGPALIWLAVMFSTLLSFQDIFSRDMADGTLEHVLLSPASGLSVVTAKAVGFAILSVGPILLALPMAGIMLGLSTITISGLALSVIFATPALAAYGTLASALMSRRGSGGFLIILISAPFLIPVLIFGLSAVDSFARTGIMAMEFRALAGLSLIGMAIGLPAASAAITANLE
ncbi:heme exporter protein CcmB [Fretibacter rubidus]|uniref:heme exporter protein CcmB n=1 Tax=Fretibacter rubidus TaxID=570162 RepID=UPI003529F033